MQEFYENFYRLAAQSPVHAEFCERVFGLNLCQHGFADMIQLQALIEVLRLEAGQRVLDLGCGTGMIAEYIADCTGAHFTGLDYISQAVELAQKRTSAKADRLSFAVGDINTLDLPPQAFDAIISIDSMYFSDDYVRTIGELARALRPGGQMGIFFAHGRAGWVGDEPFRADTLLPDRTPLADALKANGLDYTVRDFTQEDYRLAQLRRQVITELRPRFEAEGLMFIYENRIGDAQGISQSIEEGLHRRYLYHVRVDNA